MRRSSIGLPLQPSPPDAGDDVPFDDNDDIFDDGADGEEPESPSPSKQQQTSRRIGLSNGIQNGEDASTPKARSKGKAKARDESHDGEDEDEEAGRDLNDAEMQQEDEEPTPKKKPTGKRPRKRAVEFPCKKPLPWHNHHVDVISYQYLRKIRLASEEASGYATSRLNGGDARKLCMEDAIQAR